MSTILLIPWILFGFKNSQNRFFGLTQTRKSILALLLVEITFWAFLVLLLDNPDPNVAGQGSFAWMYQFIYEKGIFPTWLISESIGSSLADKIDNSFNIIYFVVALMMDYIILFLISPRLQQIVKSSGYSSRK